MTFDYAGLIRRPAEYIPDAFDPGLVTIEDIENYLNDHKYAHKELELIHPDTGQKLNYETHHGPWRGTYDPDVIENLWNIGASFILQTPYVNSKVKQMVKSIEESNHVSCDAHIYHGKKNSSSFVPHCDASINLVVQCKGHCRWMIWNTIHSSPDEFPDLRERPALEVVMNPGDAMIVPKGQIHHAQPLTDRISVSFAFSPGPKTIQRNISLDWDSK